MDSLFKFLTITFLCFGRVKQYRLVNQEIKRGHIWFLVSRYHDVNLTFLVEKFDVIYLHLFINRTLTESLTHLYWNVWYLKMSKSPNLKFPLVWCVLSMTENFTANYSEKCWWRHYQSRGLTPGVFVWVCFFFPHPTSLFQNKSNRG